MDGHGAKASIVAERLQKLPFIRNNRPTPAFEFWQRPEDPMSNRDETIRVKLLDRLTAVGVDARGLAVEVTGGLVIARGSVSSEEQRQRAMDARIGAHTLEITVRPMAYETRD